MPSKSPESSKAFTILDEVVRCSEAITLAEAELSPPDKIRRKKDGTKQRTKIKVSNEKKTEIQQRVTTIRDDINRLIAGVSSRDIIDFLLERDAMPEDINALLSHVENSVILAEVESCASKILSHKNNGLDNMDRDILKDIESKAMGLKVRKEHSGKKVQGDMEIPINSTAPSPPGTMWVDTSYRS